MTRVDTITAAQWRDLRLRAWKYQLGNRPPAGLKVVHRRDKAHLN